MEAGTNRIVERKLRLKPTTHPRELRKSLEQLVAFDPRPAGRTKYHLDHVEALSLTDKVEAVHQPPNTAHLEAWQNSVEKVRKVDGAAREAYEDLRWKRGATGIHLVERTTYDDGFVPPNVRHEFEIHYVDRTGRARIRALEPIDNVVTAAVGGR